MPKGRKKNSDDRSHMFSREDKLKLIQSAFPEMRRLTLEKAALIAEHIKPVSDSITKIGRNLKADTGVERADWWPDFLKFMRDQAAIDMDNQADTDRIQRNLKLMHDALSSGEMVNFLDVLDRVAARPDPMLQEDGEDAATDEGETGHSQDEEEREPVAPAGLTFASADEQQGSDPMLEETQLAWAGTEGTEGGEEDLDKGGYTFAEGKAAGLAGKTMGDNPHPAENPSHDLWERGRVVGAKDFIASEAAQIADEIETEAASDGGTVLTDQGDSAEVINLFGEEGDDELPSAEMLGGGEGSAQASASA